MRKSIAWLLITVLMFTAGCSAVPEREEEHEEAGSLTVSHGSGFYEENELTVQTAYPANWTVRYTLDGSAPDSGSDEVKNGEIRITETDTVLSKMADEIVPEEAEEFFGTVIDDDSLPKGTVLNITAFDENGDVADRQTYVYFLNQEIPEDIAVISLATDIGNLTDSERGIYVYGPAYEAWRETEEGKAEIESGYWFRGPANFLLKGKETERQAVIELYEPGCTEPVFSKDCGIRMRGDLSRRYSQKPFNVYFRKDYGDKTLEYDLIPGTVSAGGEEITSYKSFTLSAGGNETLRLKYRAAFLSSFADGLNAASLNYRPVLLFLNGEYWGYYFISEKISDAYIASHYGVDKDNVVVIKEEEVEEGEDEDIALYEELKAFEDLDFTEEGVYEDFCNIVDIDSFIDYYAFETYIANTDWRGDKNIAMWRVREAEEGNGYGDGKWRYILYDLDSAAGYWPDYSVRYDTTTPEYDSIDFALEKHPLFRAVFRCDEFREKFLASLDEMADTVFETEQTLARLDEYDSKWGPYILETFRRFGDQTEYYEKARQRILDFFENRAVSVHGIVEAYQMADTVEQ